VTTDTITHPAALRATHRPQIDVTSSSAAQRTALLTALRSARHPVLDGPLVLARPSAGSRTELVSVTPDGTAVHVWTPAEAA